MSDENPQPQPQLNRDDPSKSALPFPVVGIGASAGGIAALTRFFEATEPDCGMAFVVILHLSPRHESNVDEILQRTTRMPVLQVREETAIAPNHVYVIPPNHDLNMYDGHLALVDATRKGGPHVAIDLFLRTLAEVHTDRAFAVILSGMGTDGAVGLRRINECGGVTFAQHPDEAEHDSMPRAAIATGIVDFVLPVAEMAARLAALWRNLQQIRLPVEADLPHDVVTADGPDERRAAEQALKETLALLHRRTRHDFRQYKRATVLRRLERRLQVNALPDLTAYRAYLDEHPAETGLLLQDMLISVTSFFRDREVFEALERSVIPALFKDRAPDEAIRVWIAGCATGEEAYSIAMLLREQAETMADPPPIQIFATDIDERALAVARSGSYPEGIVNDLTTVRLRRFFAREGDRYRVLKTIRESVLFASHNVLHDPPFSRLDLVSCRNLLIYLDPLAQKNILDTFRFSLPDHAYLLLGLSETADSAGNGFRVVDKKQRIFQANLSAFPVRRAVAAPSYGASGLPAPLPLDRKSASAAERHRWALEQYALPSVLIDARHQILHLSPHAGEYFMRAGGAPSHELIANLKPELRVEMRSALFRANQTSAPVTVRALWASEGRQRRTIIGIHPFGDPDNGAALTLVTLQDLNDALIPLVDLQPADRDEVVAQLQSQVDDLKNDLRETIEQGDTATEELKASNEELQAINEELRSASEELETSKEELQSINEELTTVNSELKAKVEETVQVSDDLQNLIASIDIAVVFVDARMQVKRFTPRATDLFNLIDGDVGRSLLDITHRLEWPSITSDAEEAFRSLRIIEREVRGRDDRHYLSKVIPYRTVDNKIEGAVMTFVDITSRVLAEARVRVDEERLRIAAETVRHYAIITLDEAGTITTWNAGAQDTFGYAEDEIVGQPFELLFTPEDRAAGVPAAEMKAALAEKSIKEDRWHLRKDGTRFYSSGVLSAVSDGRTRGFAKITHDMTGTKLMEARRDEELLMQKQAGLAAETANRLKDEFLAVMSHELKHPLNLIHVNAELLTRLPEASGSPAIRRAAETIRRTVAGQARIIDDLLDLSRARTGKMMMTMTPTSLTELVTRIANAARGDADAKQIALMRTIDGSDDIVVVCDAVRIEQILWNLLTNAIKFTDRGGKVSVRLDRIQGEAVFEVTDSGRGIAANFLPNVFAMFRQERRETANGEGGMGIGLALVKELTEAQGGRVAVTSPGAGRGATFTVAFPLQNDLAATVVDALDDGLLRELRILAVDDSAEALEPFAELLRLDGAVVIEAHGGREALALLDREPFDLLISDIGMPGMDGYQLIDEIRRRNDAEGLVAIAMSGYGRAGDVQRATEVGFDAHLTKPASVDDLKALVVRLREQGRLRS